jgi:hypothetical protein
MNQKLVKQIISNIQGDDSVELIQRWIEDDHEKYSDDYFRAVEEVLGGRDEALPPTKDTKGLIQLWIENDRDRYSDELFKAVEEVLQGRDEALPPTKDTKGLLQLWIENDRDKYTDDLFRTVEEILRGRGQVLHVQREHGTKECPSCSFFCQSSAERCDCGYEFQTQTEEAPSIKLSQQRQPEYEEDKVSVAEKEPMVEWEIYKPSRGFLWWGGFLVVLFAFVPGKIAFTSGSIRLIAITLLSLAISAGICLLWYWFSGRRQRRSLIPSLIGGVLFGFASFIPMFIPEFLGLKFGSRGPFSMQFNWFDIVALPLFGLILLGSSYLLMFRKSKRRTKSNSKG